ncbi:MAG: hypothetical protein EHM72_03470 [Calditrichaeota bacterium]|nr:MAG: hypothetical protein EHM72_03470 [Calditrichota bacterium]
MNFIADLHIHSFYSRATSKDLNLENLYRWGKLKGLSVIATGDISHPQWFREMEAKLGEAEPGLFRLKDEYVPHDLLPTALFNNATVRYLLSGEISTIYKKNGRVRKVHSVVFMPSLQAVHLFQKRLERIGNITSDGRPILGLDTRDLLEIVLETDTDAHLVPAHIWTPWFSVFGSNSGFDSLEECFEDLYPHIFALETGLSSDPPMNWRLSMLDSFALISNSDAHSPAKLAREANLFRTELSYQGIFSALKKKTGDEFAGTIEFFPEEGKYHLDGHRKCRVRFKPSETIEHHKLCPVCGGPVVLGVSYRVEQLADRPEGFRPQEAKPYHSLIPLTEVLSEVHQSGVTSQKVQNTFMTLLKELGSELYILQQAPLDQIGRTAGDLTAEAIRRMREGQVHPEPGYDGEFGVIRIFKPEEREQILRQGLLFFVEASSALKKIPTKKTTVEDESVEYSVVESPAPGLNQEQQQAVSHRHTPLLVSAGPGTGKTKTLTHRIIALVSNNEYRAEEILALTFTNKAAEEMRVRLKSMIDPKVVDKMTISTFHAWGAALLREQQQFWGRNQFFAIIDAQLQNHIADQLATQFGKLSASLFERIAWCKSRGYTSESLPVEICESETPDFAGLFERYEQILIEENCVDFEDLIILPFRLLSQNAELRRTWLKRFPVIAVDEFQDLNRVQYELFRLLAITARDVSVYGDAEQAIYGFRGSEPSICERLINDFPHATSLRLMQNYRSIQNILTGARQMLTQEIQADTNQLWSTMHAETKIHLGAFSTEHSEAEFVVKRIEQLLGGTAFFSYDSDRVISSVTARYSFSDIAVLFRFRTLALPLIEALGRAGIPFHYADDGWLSNESFVRLILAAWRRGNNMATEDVSSVASEYFMDQMQVDHFLTQLEKWREQPDMDSFFPLMKKWVKKDDTRADTLRLLRKLQERSGPFSKSPEHLLDALLLQRRIDEMDDRADRVRLLTLHASKGLEFPVVFIVGCEEGVLPFYAEGRKCDIQEERRLMYVGMTRARFHLHLTRAKRRMLRGRRQNQEASRFTAGISTDLLQFCDAHIASQRRSQQLKLF